jgi:uncharacterized membrane protein
MFKRMSFWWQEIGSSFWFVPAVIVIGAVMLASALIFVDATVELHVEKQWPLVFGAGAAGSRGLLTAVASSMITVAGVVFSITIVALSLTSSQYTSRVLRNFMRDHSNQVVLGVFVGIFAYCLVVLRTIRSGDEGAFVPSLAVLGGLALAFLGIGFLIFFIHHIAISIQASSIIAAAALETKTAIDQFFPDGLGDSLEDDVDVRRAATDAERHWTAIASRATGYIESVDGNGLLEFAVRYCTIVRMERGIGEFVVESTPLISVAGPLPEKASAELNAMFVITHQRTVQQDVGFGIRQIVDITLKALSPGVNDTTTGVMCVDYLAVILVQLAQRRITTAYRLAEGDLRLITRAPTFQSLVSEAFNQIRQNAEGNVAVLTKLLEALETIATATRHGERLQCLKTQAQLVFVVAEQTVRPHDVEPIRVVMARFLSGIEQRKSPKSEPSV